MSAQPVSEYFEVADYLGVLRRRWLMIVAFTLIGVALGTAYYYVAPRVYTSTVLIQVNSLPTNANALGGRTGGPVNMDNEGQIVESSTVAAIARSELHSDLSVADLMKAIHVTVPPNTTFLQVGCSESNAILAEQCANAFGRAYLYNRRASALSVITSGLKQLESQATKLEANVEELRTKLADGGFKKGSAAHGVAKLDLSGDAARVTVIQNKIAAVIPLQASLSAKNNFVGQIVTPAVVPTKPVSPKKKLLLPSGLAAGLVLGLAFAFLWDWRRPRISTARDIRRRINVPTMISLLDVKNEARTVFPPPRSRTGQAYSELAQSVGTALGDGHHVLLVAGTSPGAGNSAAANLASALARIRGETMLICADPNAAPVPRLLGKADGCGFAEVLAGTAAVADVTRRTADAPQLRVLTPGLDAAGAVYDMQYDKVHRLMRDLRREVRYVVIDVPPPGVDADTFSLAEFAEGAIVVIQAGTTHPDDLTDCAERLHQLRTTVLAAVLLPGGTSGRGRAKRSSSRLTSTVPASTGPANSPSIVPGFRDDYIPDEQPVSYQPSRPAPELTPPPALPKPPVNPAPAAQPAQASRPTPTFRPRTVETDYPADYPPDYDSPVSAAQQQQKPSRSQPGTSQPVIKQVAPRRPATSGGTSGSKHAAPGHGADAQAEAPGSAGRSGSWKSSPAGEHWPLSRTALTDHDEEPGDPDPLIGG